MQMKERYRIIHTLQCVKGSPEFEYPDWSHKTVGKVLEKFK